MATNNALDIPLSGSTGSGLIVGNNTPTLITPILGVASASSINFGGGALDNYVPLTTFQPALNFGGATTGITYGTQSGVYLRIGGLVFFSIRIILTSKGSATGSATITGLPLAATGTTQTYTFPIVGETITYAAGTLVSFISSGASTVTIFTQTTASNLTAVTNAAFANTSGLYITGVYST